MRYKNITIVSTSHIAQQSVKEVKKALKEEPELVAVELDSNRLQALLSDEKGSLSILHITKIGLLGYLFALLGSWLQKKLGNIVGVKPGIEMLTAVREASKYGAMIFLIDQNLQITLKKLSSIPFKEKFRLLTELLFGWFKKDYVKLDLRKVPEQELIRKLTKELKKKFPYIYKVLVDDRNKIMARNIIYIVKQNPGKKLLVVVGAGHTDGIIKILKRNF